MAHVTVTSRDIKQLLRYSANPVPTPDLPSNQGVIRRRVLTLPSSVGAPPFGTLLHLMLLVSAEFISLFDAAGSGSLHLPLSCVLDQRMAYRDSP